MAQIQKTSYALQQTSKQIFRKIAKDEILAKKTSMEFDWKNKWLKGDEYAHILENIEIYCKKYNFLKLPPKTHPLFIYTQPQNGIIYFVEGNSIGSEFGFPRVDIRKRYRWKKMNFTTDLPKRRPYVTYIVASAVKCEKFFPNSRNEGPSYRMHAVILNKKGKQSQRYKVKQRNVVSSMVECQESNTNPLASSNTGFSNNSIGVNDGDGVSLKRKKNNTRCGHEANKQLQDENNNSLHQEKVNIIGQSYKDSKKTQKKNYILCHIRKIDQNYKLSKKRKSNHGLNLDEILAEEFASKPLAIPSGIWQYHPDSHDLAYTTIGHMTKGHGIMDHMTKGNTTMGHTIKGHMTIGHTTLGHTSFGPRTMSYTALGHAAMDHTTKDHIVMGHPTMGYDTEHKENKAQMIRLTREAFPLNLKVLLANEINCGLMPNQGLGNSDIVKEDEENDSLGGKLAKPKAKRPQIIKPDDIGAGYMGMGLDTVIKKVKLEVLSKRKLGNVSSGGSTNGAIDANGGNANGASGANGGASGANGSASGGTNGANGVNSGANGANGSTSGGGCDKIECEKGYLLNQRKWLSIGELGFGLDNALLKGIVKYTGGGGDADDSDGNYDYYKMFINMLMAQRK